jgi:hypothetical protein
VCDNCFDPSSFEGIQEETKGSRKRKRKLKPDAVPLRNEQPYAETDDGKRLAYQLDSCRICLKNGVKFNRCFAIDEFIEESFFQYTRTKVRTFCDLKNQLS